VNHFEVSDKRPHKLSHTTESDDKKDAEQDNDDDSDDSDDVEERLEIESFGKKNILT
jgi:hypothetical protein